jgi:hypothetical protein
MISNDGQWISNDNGQCPLAVAFAFLFQHKHMQRFEALDRACKDEWDGAFSALEMRFVAFFIAKSL